MNNEKRQLRNEMIDKRNSIKEYKKMLYDKKIFESICSLPEYLHSNLVLPYVSYGSEADTIRIIKISLKNHKVIAVPKILSDGKMDFFIIQSIEDLKPGTMNILEPEGAEEKSISLMIKNKKINNAIMLIPGLAFDKQMNRLGYGKGYYDNYISFLHKEHVTITKAALLYESQLIKSVPTDSHDMKMDMLITPDRIITNRAYC